jgi:hypothetical protein
MAIKLIVVLCALVICGCSDEKRMSSASESTTPKVALGQTAPVEDKARDCMENTVAQKAKYDELMAQKDYFVAAAVVRECANVLNSFSLKALLADAEYKQYKLKFNDPKASVDDIEEAAQRIKEIHPEYAKDIDSKLAGFKARAQKRAGVRIGMNAADVRASNWGRPRTINRTVTAAGAREQWVYEGGYLYFENGIVTAIQN